MSDDLLDRARAWMAEDPDPVTRAELGELVDRGDADALRELADRFRGPLVFGTAGLRGRLGAGPNRMNRVVVIRAAAGLAAYLLDGGAAPGSPIVIGYDARHNSAVFAHDTAEVMAGAGLRPLLLPRALPTPVLAYAIRDLDCVAGVMVTASHNPPQDNGYKVYLGDGTQIVPPADEGIAERIAAVGPLVAVSRTAVGDEVVLGEQVVDRYLDALASVVPAGSTDLRIVYTPMHGVGGAVMEAAFTRAGFRDVTVVPQQAEPDADFPTVAFPNPEEPGAMDLALSLARERDADVVIANDPDADRCAVGVPVVSTGSTGLEDAVTGAGWRMLRGDEVGALLGEWLLRTGRTGTYATSIVSSSLLLTQAAAYGQEAVETLTGFKWIGRLPGLAFGYEEALGYCVDPDHVADKDGVSAALAVCAMAAAARAEGRTLLDELDDIALRYGLYATDQLSVRVTDLSEISAAMDRLRSTPAIRLGGRAVESIEDLAAGTAGLPPTDGLRYRLAGHGRVVVRPSGTEPKLKCYLEVVVPIGAGGDVEAARAAATEELAALKADVAAAAGIEL
ncbi:MAG: phospho-sugar mutase [Nocardioidaceae bacterium]|nr:phospho-sugar mutase [Nocardioidaceae bacterium]MCL2615164.1 phospho-sugar mutase [Nocardioidaceae bacterium]